MGSLRYAGGENESDSNECKHQRFYVDEKREELPNKEWFLSMLQRNKAMHSLNGNIEDQKTTVSLSHHLSSTGPAQRVNFSLKIEDRGSAVDLSAAPHSFEGPQMK